MNNRFTIQPNKSISEKTIEDISYGLAVIVRKLKYY